MARAGRADPALRIIRGRGRVDPSLRGLMQELFGWRDLDGQEDGRARPPVNGGRPQDGLFPGDWREGRQGQHDDRERLSGGPMTDGCCSALGQSTAGSPGVGEKAAITVAHGTD